MSTEHTFDLDRLLERLRLAMAQQDKGASLREVLIEERPENLAEALEELSPEEQRMIFDGLDPEAAGRILREVDEDVIEDIAEAFPREVAEAVVEMEPDDAADVLENLPSAQTHDILHSMPAAEAQNLRSILHYEEDTAGSIMTTEFILMWSGLTAANAVNITQHTEEKETGGHLFVADDKDALIGYLPLHRLVFAKPDRKLSELMTPDLITVKTDTDQEEVVRLATKFNLDVVPVVDNDRRLIGVITPDDILEAAQDEVDADMYLLAGMDEEQDPVRDSVYDRTRVRLPWLLISLIGGNVAIQASTLVVRGLATGTISPERMKKFLVHEMVVTLVLAVCCGLSGMVLSLILVSENPKLSLAVASAIASAVCVAGGLGMVFPVLCHKLGVDPAVSAGPFVTSSTIWPAY